ncbi:MAG: hypothetical protein JW768_12840 [Chitinispirillaceae bacterium]|nr:hypothetical protein [Chitinispirillaceae bacterium]
MKGSVFSINRIAFALFIAFSGSDGARPLATDDAQTVDPGAFELEFGYDFSHTINDSQNHSMGISLKHGLSERLDMGIAFPYEIEPKRGFGSAEMAIKYSFVKEKKRIPAMSSTFSFDLGSSGYTINGIATKTFDVVCIYINVGYTATGQTEKKGTVIYGTAIEFFLIERLAAVTELVGESVDDSMALEALFGLKFYVIEAFALDLAAAKGFLDTEANWQTVVGMTFVF